MDSAGSAKGQTKLPWPGKEDLAEHEHMLAEFYKQSFADEGIDLRLNFAEWVYLAGAISAIACEGGRLKCLEELEIPTEDQAAAIKYIEELRKEVAHV